MAVFSRMLAIAPSPAQAEGVQSVAAEMAQLTGARLLSACVPDEAIVEVAVREAADVVVLEGRNADRPEGRRGTARRCLDAGLSVIAIPALRRPGFPLDHIGLGHDLSASIVDAQGVMRKLVASMGEADRHRDQRDEHEQRLSDRAIKALGCLADARVAAAGCATARDGSGRAAAP